MSGLFGSRPQTSTSESSFSGTETRSGTRTKQQSRLFKDTLDQLMAQISQGPAIMQSDRDALRGSINRGYNAQQQQVEAGLTGRGFGESGKLGNAFKQLDIARSNDFATGEQGLMQDAQQRYAQMIQLAWPYLHPDNWTTTSSGSTTGSQTRPGPSVFDRILGYAGQAAGIAALAGV
jgi:hypothetical protein